MSESLINLTFKQGQFFLRASEAAIEKYSDRSLWNIVEPGLHGSAGLYLSSHLKAGRAFRRYGDSIAEKVFNRAFAKHYDLPRLPRLSFLDPHQISGVHWILERSRSYLAHAPGAGKTAQMIVASIFAAGPGQTLFIVPPSLTANWEREIWAFTEPLGIYPTIGVVPTSDRRASMAWRADFIICPDSMLTKPWVYERLESARFKFIGVDEASRFKEPTTERGLAFYGGQTKKRSYHGLYQRARHVVFADGSPMPNRPMELWAPTYALHPEAIDCMDQRDFGFRYCGAKQNDYGQWEFNHSSNESELRARLQKDFMHVVTEEELSHPERQRSLLFMNQDVRSPEHKSWERRHLQTLTFDEVSEDMSQGQMAHFRRELGVRKIPWAYQYIRERLAGKKESLLIFAWHREVAIELHRKLTLAGHKIGLVIGGTKASEREELFVGFQAGKIDGIIGNIQAMGRGHNLQRAKRVIFVEYSWTDELNKQCEKRASRRGNEEAFVRCEYLVSPNSMDEPLLNSIFTKQTRTRKVIG